MAQRPIAAKQFLKAMRLKKKQAVSMPQSSHSDWRAYKSIAYLGKHNLLLPTK